MSSAMFKNHEGEMEMPVVGEWYSANYGLEVVTGQCVSVLRNGVMLKFRWGDVLRQEYFVQSWRILDKTPDPRILTKLRRFLK